MLKRCKNLNHRYLPKVCFDQITLVGNSAFCNYGKWFECKEARPFWFTVLVFKQYEKVISSFIQLIHLFFLLFTGPWWYQSKYRQFLFMIIPLQPEIIESFDLKKEFFEISDTCHRRMQTMSKQINVHSRSFSFSDLKSSSIRQFALLRGNKVKIRLIVIIRLSGTPWSSWPPWTSSKSRYLFVFRGLNTSF